MGGGSDTEDEKQMARDSHGNAACFFRLPKTFLMLLKIFSCFKKSMLFLILIPTVLIRTFYDDFFEEKSSFFLFQGQFNYDPMLAQS